MDEATFSQIGERLTKALLSGDFDLYRQVMDLPIKIEPMGAVAYTLTDIKGLQADFDLYHLSIKSRRVTDIYRKVKKIEETAEGGFAVTCLMHILAGTERVIDPFLSIMTLQMTPEGWRFNHIQSSLRHIQWTLGDTDL